MDSLAVLRLARASRRRGCLRAAGASGAQTRKGRREMSRRPASARADNRSRKRAIGAPSYRFGSRRCDSSHAERLVNGENRD